MRHDQSYEIDKKKLKKALIAKGKSFEQASAEIGMSKNYLGMRISRYGSLPKNIVYFLEKVYGIRYVEYAGEQESAKETQEELRGRMIDKQDILDALKEALNSYAWQETIARTVRFILREEPTEDMIKRIIYEAIEEKLG